MLTKDGAFASTFVGGIVFGFGGVNWGILLVIFFSASSFLTLWKAKEKPQPEHKKGRSAGQVLGSGGAAAALALIHGSTLIHGFLPLFKGEPGKINLLTTLGFAGALAAICADTWATEIGLLGSSIPRLITTWKPVEPGTSGGITWLGTSGGFLGAGFIAAFSSILLKTPAAPIWISGFAAMILDSLMGALIEGRHPLFNNSSVNFLASLFGAGLALLI